MTFSDIVIVGPTSTGKTELANFIASNSNSPIFNCDAIQVYKGLDLLTNKPSFIQQEEQDSEVISYTNPTSILDFSKWKEFTFRILVRENNNLTAVKFENYKEFVQFLIDKQLISNQVVENNTLIKNYLFDVRNPLQKYSLADFTDDVERISKNLNLKSKILVGGTIYYAYHYIFQTEFEKVFEDYAFVTKIRDEISRLDLPEMLQELMEKDPEALKLVDNQNKQRVGKALEYIRRTGNTFSGKYFKNMSPLDNFILISIYPKDKEKYYKQLDSIVEKRMNFNVFKEIETLEQKYTGQVRNWLREISYQYRYALELRKLFAQNADHQNEFQVSPTISEDMKRLLNELKLKERHYAKRQMTFMKKLEKDLQKISALM